MSKIQDIKDVAPALEALEAVELTSADLDTVNGGKPEISITITIKF